MNVTINLIMKVGCICLHRRKTATRTPSAAIKTKNHSGTKFIQQFDIILCALFPTTSNRTKEHLNPASRTYHMTVQAACLSV